MLDKVRKTVEKYGMLRKGDSVTVGLSGGADSVTLMSVLCALKNEYNLNISAVHINHGIRGEEAERDESFVIALCREMNVPLRVYHRNIPSEAKISGESEEECGRRIRYECFKEAGDGEKTATAHTLSDSIETMIFNMLRGSSSSGLCGIPAKRDNIIRPLIECTRDEIEKYCLENGLSFVTDSTNLKSDYTRNYIRHEILPMFSRVNSSYITALSRLREFIAEDNAYLEREANLLISRARTAYGLSAKILLESEAVIIKRALVLFIKEKCGISPESRHIELVFENIEKNYTLQLDKDYYVCVCSGEMSVKRKKEAVLKNNEILPLKEGENRFSDSVITAEKISREVFSKNYNKLLENSVDCDKIVGDIFIRSRREGDCVFLSRRKVTKTLKKLFCEMKIPPEERDKIPLVCDSEKVLWVSGIGANGVCRAERETKNILLLTKK